MSMTQQHKEVRYEIESAFEDLGVGCVWQRCINGFNQNDG